MAGAAAGFLGVYGATLRFAAFRSLTLPLKAFLVTSAGTFAGKFLFRLLNGPECPELGTCEKMEFTRESGYIEDALHIDCDVLDSVHQLGVDVNWANVTMCKAIVSADKYSRAFEASRHPEEQYKDEAERQRLELEASKSQFQRVKDWGKANRYPIVGVSWVASMAIALGLVGRSPYLSTSQKIVQARVYAQGLTLAVLVATAAFEIGDANNDQGRWETIKIVDPNDPEHKHLIEKKIHHERYAGEDMWRDMVSAEEQRIQEREDAAHEQEEHDAKAGKNKHKKKEHHEEKKPEKKEQHAEKKSDKKVNSK